MVNALLILDIIFGIINRLRLADKNLSVLPQIMITLRGFFCFYLHKHVGGT